MNFEAHVLKEIATTVYNNDSVKPDIRLILFLFVDAETD
jgi:hypothetical protein